MNQIFTIGIWLIAIPLFAQIEVTAPAGSQMAFPGPDRRIQVRLRNAGDKDIEAKLGMKLYQASSATATPLGPVRPWKRLTVKAGQTVLDEFKAELPSVRARSRFILQCINEEGVILGKLDVFVYPADLLKELIDLTGAKGIGLFDPEGRITPVLKRLEIPNSEWAFGDDRSDSTEALLILGPFSEERPLTAKMKQSIDTMVRAGRRLVCLHQTDDAIFPWPGVVTIYDAEKGRLVTAPPGMVADLEQSIASQLTLIRLVKLAESTNRWALATAER